MLEAIAQVAPAFQRLGEVAREGAGAVSRFVALVVAEPFGRLRLVDGIAVPDERPLLEWAADFERMRQLARDDVMCSRPTDLVDVNERVGFVSTVFLGQDLLGSGPFETLVEHGDESDVVERYDTMGHALAGHIRHLARLVRVCTVAAEDDARVFARRVAWSPTPLALASGGFPSIPVDRSDDMLDALEYSRRPPRPPLRPRRDDYAVGFRPSTAAEVDEQRERHGGGARQETLQNREHFATRGELPEGAHEALGVVDRIDAVLRDQEVRSINPHDQLDEVLHGRPVSEEQAARLRNEPLAGGNRLHRAIEEEEWRRRGGTAVALPQPMNPPVRFRRLADPPDLAELGPDAVVPVVQERTPWGGYDPSQLEPPHGDGYPGLRVYGRALDPVSSHVTIFSINVDGRRWVEQVPEMDIVTVDREEGVRRGWLPPLGVEPVGPYLEIGRRRETLRSFLSGFSDPTQSRIGSDENEPAAANARRTPEVRDEEDF